MMTFITLCCLAITALICFAACAGICEEINQTPDGPQDLGRDHHYEIHQRDMEKMDRIIDLFEEMESKVTQL